jgi:hypothetical protein
MSVSVVIYLCSSVYIYDRILQNIAAIAKKIRKKYGAQPMLRIIQFCLQATTPMVEGSR